MIDGALDDLAGRIALRRAVPRVARGHFAERQRQALFRCVDFANPAGDAGADGDVGVALLHAERKLRVVNESVDARLDLDEEAEVGRAHDAAAELRAGRITVADVAPGIRLLILHRE